MRIKIIVSSFVIFFTCNLLAFPALADAANAMPHSLAPMLKKVMPSIVSITGTKRIQAYPVPVMPGQNTALPPANPQDVQEQVSQMIGSGVIVDKNQGYILTNAHVVTELDEIDVLLSDNRHFHAKLIGSDKDTDLALLKISAENLTQATFADSDVVQVGDFVVAIGSPYGFNQTVTSGIVSAIGRNDVGLDGYYDFIQTDADINMGNSGGGLVNLQGQLIGINTMIITPQNGGGGSVGLGFAIPSNMARGIMSQLAAQGFVDRGSLGVRAQPLTPELARAFKLNATEGALINEVMPKTPADIAGLRPGDVILSLNGKTVKDYFHLRTLISLIPPGSKAKLQYMRNGQQLEVTILMTNPRERYTAGEKIFPGLKGAFLAPTDPDAPLQGIRVVEIKPDSPVAGFDLSPDDIIVAATNDAIATPTIEALSKAAQTQKDVLLLCVIREQYSFFVAVAK